MRQQLKNSTVEGPLLHNTMLVETGFTACATGIGDCSPMQGGETDIFHLCRASPDALVVNDGQVVAVLEAKAQKKA